MFTQACQINSDVSVKLAREFNLNSVKLTMKLYVCLYCCSL